MKNEHTYQMSTFLSKTDRIWLLPAIGYKYEEPGIHTITFMFLKWSFEIQTY